MRKFIFNGAVISAAFSLWSTIQAARSGPRDWRIILGWVNAGISLAIAIGTVVQDSKEAEISEKSR
ncbi:hypothetical protein [Leifsonia poae]|uniref:hypothetical protein n=1 Tax=Leifsonia poae TaxID=110933 RepID=UPI003D679746